MKINLKKKTDTVIQEIGNLVFIKKYNLSIESKASSNSFNPSVIDQYIH